MSQSKPDVRPESHTIPDGAPRVPRLFELTLLDAPSLPVSLIRQAGELLCEKRNPSRRRDLPQARLPVSDQHPWYRELPDQIQAFISTPNAVPARFNPRPADVPDLWQDYQPNPFSWANSLLIHLFALTAMLLPFAIRQMVNPTPLPQKPFDLTHLVFPISPLHGQADKTRGGGGSGNRTPLPASRGVLPPFARTQFTPALAIIPKMRPVLPMPATIVGPPELNSPSMKMDQPWGDPNGPMSQFSGGPGTGGSFGNGDGTGIGPGKGPGAGPGEGGGCCEGAFSVGNGVSAPIPIYSPEPAYSEEARKAKFGGIATLWIIVDAQGNVGKIQIARHLPMGLDEEAVKAVRTWKFRPAIRQGVAVPVQVQVEVSFRLF